ncbi:hypothetical protein EUX98_g9490, partial [Antrodiella citrinella]
ACDWHQLELWVEFKLKEEYDAFVTNYDKITELLDATNQHAVATHGQIVSYAVTQLARQHRGFIFSLLICGRHARFIRWDRAGSIVSAHFDYIDEAELLTEFFLRYGQLTNRKKGFNPTVKLATAKEKARFHAAIDKHLNDPQKRQFPEMKKAMDESVPAQRIKISGSSLDGKKATRSYIIQRPFTYPESPVGRSTRAYLALDLKMKKLVFVKDYWRPAEPDRVPEPDIYAALKKANVPHLPVVLLAGDVPDSTKTAVQTTLTQDWSTKPGVCLTGLALRQYRHIRIVQELLYPLSTVKNSQELVKSIGIQEAFKEKWLHRDVSAGNIMLNEAGEGVLNDWDHGLKIDVERKAAFARTGTWQFLSIAIAKSPNKGHDVLDDLESCYWVLLFASIHYFESNALAFAFDMFNECNIEVVDDIPLATGGQAKWNFLCFPQDHCIVFKCDALDAMIMKLLRYHRKYYTAMTEAMFDPQEFEDYRNSQLVDPGRTALDIIKDALKGPNWREADALNDRFRPKKQHAHNKAVEDIIRNHVKSTSAHAADSLDAVPPSVEGTLSNDPPSAGPSEAGMLARGGKRVLQEDEGEPRMDTDESRSSKRPRTASDVIPAPVFDPPVRSGGQRGGRRGGQQGAGVGSTEGSHGMARRSSKK